MQQAKLSEGFWRTSLRFYNKDALGKQRKGKGFRQKSEQDLLELKQKEKNYIHLDSLRSQPDICSVFLDKTYRATEIVRTPDIPIIE